MKKQYSISNRLFLFSLILSLVILLSACGSENETPTSAPTSTAAVAAATETPEPATDTPTPEPTDPPPTETPTLAPTNTPEPTATPTRTPLELAQSATVRIQVGGSEYLEALIGAGTGVIYDSSGLVLTSNHLVDGAGLVEVSIEGREESLSAQIVGRSACDNLAVLQLLGSDFPAASLSEADALTDALQVIGYPLGDTSQTIEESAANEETLLLTAGFSDITGTVQLDTALDTGYSGAPILTGNGLLTGLVVYPGSESQHAAVLPLSKMMPVVAELEQGNNLNWIGLNAGPISAEAAEQLEIEITPGLFVYAVDFRGPGGQADVRNGDIITEISGLDVTNEDGLEQYCSVLRENTEDEPLDIVVVRNGSRYLGQINGDPLTEEVVVEAPEEAPGEAPGEGEEPPAEDTKSAMLAAMQSVDADLRSVGGTIDSLAANGCLNPPLLANSGDGPGSAGPTAETELHPGCIHSISDCQVILDKYANITNPPIPDLTGASEEVFNAHASLQAAITTFVEGANTLVEACRAFVNDPNLTIGPLAFGLARQGVDQARSILTPAIEQLTVNS